MTQTKTVHLGDGFVSQSSRWLHFGLRDLAEVDSVEVIWPNGVSEKIVGLKKAGRFVIKQGEGMAREAKVRQVKSLKPEKAAVPESSDIVRIWLSKPRPLKGQKLLADMPPEPFFLNLWASWCPPCLAELGEFSKAPDLPLVLMNVENAGDEKKTESGNLTRETRRLPV